ncbi:formimidoylglutamase [Salipaludibacillus sp. CUR1]|uniref:formimidoylglutamase n=1 Tax=Salipaludibacillus sp. CUR1 TaxID=2820003 RepID=UPI002103DEEF|nr:formimidoylglutamase [Salipaludibacillus sp. CUR1]
MADYPFLKKAGTPFKDTEMTKVAEIIKEADGDNGEITGAGLIGAPLSKSSISHSGASFAPGTIRKALGGFSTYAIEDNTDLSGMTISDLGDVAMHVTDIKQSQRRVFEAFDHVYKNNPQWLPVVLGGDNSVSFPSIQAFAEHKGSVGVIQFDAHHDVRNLEDGGPTNGTPFRSLLETETIEGQNLVQVGIRDFSNSKAYRAYAEEKGVAIYTMKDVRDKPVTGILAEAVERMRERVDAIYVSVDMDVIDQAQAPGCPAIGPGGMDAADLFDAVSFLGAEPKVKGIEIVEIDPTVDFRDMTSRLAAHVILYFLKAKMKEGK